MYEGLQSCKSFDIGLVHVRKSMAWSKRNQASAMGMMKGNWKFRKVSPKTGILQCAD